MGAENPQIDDRTSAERIADLEAEIAKNQAALGQVIHVVNSIVSRLWGDQQAKAKHEEAAAAWRKNRSMYVCPMPPFPEAPGPGQIEQLLTGLEALSRVIETEQSMTTTRVMTVEKELERRLSFVDKVSAWMGPIMDDPEFQPPLNAQQVASKKWVDHHLGVLAAALRRDLEAANDLVAKMREFGEQVIVAETERGDREGLSPLWFAVEAITNTWFWARSAAKKQGKPSRWSIARQALGQLITGEPRE